MAVSSTNFLKETCQRTQSCWAVRLIWAQTVWKIVDSYRLPRTRQPALMALLAQKPVAVWLSGTLSNGRGRSRTLNVDELDCARLYAFPENGRGAVILVGNKQEMTSDAQREWRTALANSHSAATEKQNSIHLALVIELNQQISSIQNLSELLDRALPVLERGFSATALTLYLQAGNAASLRVYRRETISAELQVSELAQNPFRTMQAQSDFVFFGEKKRRPARLPVASDVASGMFLPLRYLGKPIGVLAIESSNPAAFSESDAQLFSLLGAQVAGLVEYIRLRDEADERAAYLQRTVDTLQETQQELQARIGALHEAESRLVQAAKLAAVGEMAAGVAHELNNPLTSVVGFTELVLDDLPPESSARNDLDIVLREAQRAKSVVRRLLDFSRQSESSRVRADIGEIIDDVVMLTKHLLHTSGVELSIHQTKNLPWVRIDRNQIKQVLINLINNAIYAMPQGGQLRIQTARRSYYGRPWITISVVDTGMGIPEENLERIFEPFFTTRGDRGGTGLGLSVTYGIVTDHGGRIEVESRENIGTTFTVWLPLEETE